MKEIILAKTSDKLISALRCSTRVFEKLEQMALDNKCTKQDVIRAILENVIDEIKIR